MTGKDGYVTVETDDGRRVRMRRSTVRRRVRAEDGEGKERGVGEKGDEEAETESEVEEER